MQTNRRNIICVSQITSETSLMPISVLEEGILSGHTTFNLKGSSIPTILELYHGVASDHATYFSS